MDLHGMARGFISQVNPEVPANIRRSSGFTTLPNGKQEPSYHPPEAVMLQKQELTMRELQQIDNVVKQGVTCSVYVPGNYYGVTSFLMYCLYTAVAVVLIVCYFHYV